MDRGACWATVPMGCKESDTTEQVTLSLYDYTVDVTESRVRSDRQSA